MFIYHENQKKRERATAKFYLKKNQIVTLRVIIKRAKFEESTGIKWPTEKFDHENGFIIPRSSKDIEYFQFIKSLYEIMRKVEQAFNYLNGRLTIESFKSIFINSKQSYLCDYIKNVIENTQASDSTKRTYRHWLATIKTFDNPLLAEVNYQWLKEMSVFFLQEGKSINTVACFHSLIKKSINKAIRTKMLLYNPYNEWEITKEVTKQRTLSKDEVSILWNLWLSDELTGYKQEALRTYLFAFFTGLRGSDVFDLQKRHIQQNRINKTCVKTGKTLGVFINQNAALLLEEGLFNGDHDYINHLLGKIAKLAQIERFTMHSARRAHATILADLSGDVFVVKDSLGHADIKDSMV